jgi:hypothetical protein
MIWLQNQNNKNKTLTQKPKPHIIIKLILLYFSYNLQLFFILFTYLGNLIFVILCIEQRRRVSFERISFIIIYIF